MKVEGKVITANTHRAIDIKLPFSVFREFGFWHSFWGTDIFINNIPFLKMLVLANIIVWLLFAK